MLGVMVQNSGTEGLGDLATVSSFVVAIVTILDIRRRGRLDILLSC